MRFRVPPKSLRQNLTYADPVLTFTAWRVIDQLAAFADVDAWIQVACPRLSIDWGHFFDKVRNALPGMYWRLHVAKSRSYEYASTKAARC